jgi:hypothetical protein
MKAFEYYEEVSTWLENKTEKYSKMSAYELLRLKQKVGEESDGRDVEDWKEIGDAYAALPKAERDEAEKKFEADRAAERKASYERGQASIKEQDRLREEWRAKKAAEEAAKKKSKSKRNKT